MSFLASILLEIVSEILAEVAMPSTNRGVVLLLTAGSAVLGAFTAWFVVGSADPLKDPPSLLGMMALAMGFAAGATYLCGLHAVREPGDRLVGLACLTLNVAVGAAPLAALAI